MKQIFFIIATLCIYGFAQANPCENVPGNVNVLLPNPGDCTTFIQCVHQKPVVQECPPGLHWNTERSWCDWPELARCNVNTCANIPSNVDVLLPNPEDCGSYIQCVHQKPVVRSCPNGLHWNADRRICDWPSAARCSSSSAVPIPDSKSIVLSKVASFSSNPIVAACIGVREDIDVLFSNPGDCSSYIQCVHQTPVVRPCPPGLLFNAEKKVCDWPSNVKCRSEVSCAGVSPDVDVLLPNPEDCGSYIQCVHQEPVVRECQSGLHWSVSSRTCDYPHLAKCGSYAEPKPASGSSRKIKVVSSSSNPLVAACIGVREDTDVLFSNPGDCSSYIQCVHQTPVVRPCPPGLLFNAEKKVCDWPSNVKCRSEVSCAGVSSEVDVLLPNPEDCGSYIQCVHQEPVVRECQQGLHWSVSSQTCDYPHLARCQ